MGNDALFGRYWAAESPVHALDPRTKLVGMLVLVVVLLLCRSVPGLAVLAAFTGALFLIAKIPLGQALRSIAPLMFIVVLTALFNLFYVQGGTLRFSWLWFNVSDAGIAMAAFMAVRLTLLLLIGSLLTLTTTTIDITEAFEWALAPLARIGVPAHEFSMVLGIALRFLPQFVQEFRTIRQAQVSRGAQLATSPTRGGISGLTSLLVPLFASAFRHAETLSAAMDARCYHGASGRTRLHPLAFGRDDALCAAVLAVVLAVVLALQVLF